jgi:hypothetical protein
MTLKSIIWLGLIFRCIEFSGQTIEEPQWQMNFYFEDATGARDTLTLGYDPSADPYWTFIDYQYNEGWQWIDTTKFNVYILKYGTGGDMYPVYPPIDTDSVRKKSIASWPNPGILFGWVHGMLPVTVKWDADQLDSPDLPTHFIDLVSYPRARVDLWYQPTGYFSEPQCATIIADPPPPTTILTNSETYTWPAPCVMVDSLVWNSDPPEEPGYSILPPELLVVPFNDIYWYIDVEEIDNNIRIFPNPAKDYIIIYLDTDIVLEVQLVDIFGKACSLKTRCLPGENRIDLTALPTGVYFLKTTADNEESVFKIVILK